MDSFEHALEKENERLRADVERLTRERDEARIEYERLRSIIKAGRAAHNEDRVRADTLGRERDEERRMRIIHEEAAAGARNDHAEVVERLRVAEGERDEAVRKDDLRTSALRDLHLDMDNARVPGTYRPLEERVSALWAERDEWKARAENAEQERDLAVRNFGTCERMRAEWKTRAEAAEAYNAALLQEMQRACDSSVPDEWNDILHAALDAKHPGAALLERLRAAEEVCTAARRVDTFEDFSEPVLAGVDGAPDDPTAMNEARAALTSALRAYDAAKEGK